MTVAIFEVSRSVLKSAQHNKGYRYIMPDWPSWSIKEASEKTGYHPEYIRQLVSSGKIEGEKLGQMWLIKVESLMDYIKEAEDTNDARFGPHQAR